VIETSWNGSVKDVGGVDGEGARKRRKFSPEDKYQIFLEAGRGDVPVAAVLRKWGIYSSDLARIREQVRRGALEVLARGNGKMKEDPRIAQLKGEKARVEEALKELAIDNALLRKKVG
jgi:transposase-like protein